MTVLLISDVHTRYDVINAQVHHAEKDGGGDIDRVVVLGDFGFFRDELNDYFRRRKQRFTRPVACIDGNHEDHGALPDLARRYADVVSFQPRGSLLDLDSWRGLCLGGARYMDAASTPRGSEITERDVAACLAHERDAVNLILSHDCPEGLDVPNTPGLEHYGTPGVPELSRIADYYQPMLWIFGHHHRWFDLTREGTRYIGLPQSWQGYALLDDAGAIELVRNEVACTSRPWWKLLLGMK